jgi:hypothetical protein
MRERDARGDGEEWVTIAHATYTTLFRSEVLMHTHVFDIVWDVGMVLSLMYVGYKAIARFKRGPLFPKPGQCQILFRENWASGRSMENVFTRNGGARNALNLTVTPDELWTSSWFPFSLAAEIYDLEHRIKKQDILAIGEVKGLMKRVLVVEYRRKDGRKARLELVPRRYAEFKQALEAGTHVA